MSLSFIFFSQRNRFVFVYMYIFYKSWLIIRRVFDGSFWLVSPDFCIKTHVLRHLQDVFWHHKDPLRSNQRNTVNNLKQVKNLDHDKYGKDISVFLAGNQMTCFQYGKLEHMVKYNVQENEPVHCHTFVYTLLHH